MDTDTGDIGANPEKCCTGERDIMCRPGEQGPAGGQHRVHGNRHTDAECIVSGSEGQEGCGDEGKCRQAKVAVVAGGQRSHVVGLPNSPCGLKSRMMTNSR